MYLFQKKNSKKRYTSMLQNQFKAFAVPSKLEGSTCPSRIILDRLSATFSTKTAQRHAGLLTSWVHDARCGGGVKRGSAHPPPNKPAPVLGQPHRSYPTSSIGLLKATPSPNRSTIVVTSPNRSTIVVTSSNRRTIVATSSNRSTIVVSINRSS